MSMPSPQTTLRGLTTPVVVLAQVRSRAEERLVDKWALEHHPGAIVLQSHPAGLRDVLRQHDLRLVPARVLWNLPSGDDWGSSISDLLLAPLRRSPWAGLHRPLLSLTSQAASVVEGEPATVGDLLDAFADDARTGTFEEFVAERALLSCDRAERRLVGDRYKVPRLMTEQITASRDYSLRVEAAATKDGTTPDEFEDNVNNCFKEMVAVQSPIAIDLFRVLTSPLHAKTWNVDVDAESLDRLRALNRTAALVFLPSHRSYVDPLVMAEVFHRHNFPRNHVLGGDNMSFWPFGPIGKRAGVVFIRRSFGEDRAYKFAVREYLGHLMSKRFNLEWYIEGGRTRTGKLRPPRYGLLRYLVDALEHDPNRDVILIPTSIMYEQLHEVGAVVAEQVGATKRAEGARWFLNYVREQRQHIGEAKVTFGEPIGLREALEAAGTGQSRLEKVAFQVCAGINEATPVMTTSVVTFALLSTEGRALTLPQIGAVTRPLLDYLDRRGIAGPHDRLRDPEALRESLDGLNRAGVVTCYEGGQEPVWSIPADRHHVAAFYRNGAVHHLVVRAIIELALIGITQEESTADLAEVGAEYSTALRDLLKFEFFFSDKLALGADLERELNLLDPEWEALGMATPGAQHLLAACETLVAPRALRSIFEAQFVLAELLEAAEGEVQKDALIRSCLDVGRQRLLQGEILNPDSISQELYSGAWELAANRGLVGEPSEALREDRRTFLAEITNVVGLLDDAARRNAELVNQAVSHG